jgi:hypothetical protein
MAYRACKISQASGATPKETMELMAQVVRECDQPEGPGAGAGSVDPNSSSGVDPGVANHAEGSSDDTEGLPEMDWKPGSYMAKAVGDVVSWSQKAASATGLGFDGAGPCIMAAFMERRGEVMMNRWYEPGATHVVVALGSIGAKDLDLIVEDEDGRLIARDSEVDRNPTVEFTVDRAGAYRVRAVMADVESSGAFVAMAFLTSDTSGYQIPAEKFAESFTAALSHAEYASTRIATSTRYGGLVFHANRQDASFYSDVLKSGETTQYTGIDLDGPSVVLAGCDSDCSDIDIVVEGPGGPWSDTDSDARPTVIVPIDSPGKFTVKVIRKDRGDPCLVTTMILRLQN